MTLLYRLAGPGSESAEREIPMTRAGSNGRRVVFSAEIPPQAAGQLIRFRVRAEDDEGGRRFSPSPHDVRPTYSCFTYGGGEAATIPAGLIVHVDKAAAGSSSRPSFRRFFRGRGGPAPSLSPRGGAAFIFVSPDRKRHRTYDHVQVVPRSGGYKVRFHKDRRLQLEDPQGDEAVEVGTINLIFESRPKFVLAEPLAYEVYRRAGVPSPLAEHVRLSIDGEVRGYYLLVEQPNRSFLRRNGRDDRGNSYKILWYGRGVIGQHEKKTHTNSGHDDLVALIDLLDSTQGEEQWRVIEQRFNVDEVASYFAVNMCLSNWDGFFNNYFTYHDTRGTGKWEIYPWDEDKTWGVHDGVPDGKIFHDMPLTFGMKGAGEGFDFRGYWRPPGYFSGPLLANPEFRKRFLARLKEITDTIYTEDVFVPVIEALERRLAPEVRIRARAEGQDEDGALRRFRTDIRTLREHLTKRREFILAQDEMRNLAR